MVFILNLPDVSFVVWIFLTFCETCRFITICGSLAPSSGESATVHIKKIARPAGPIRGQVEKSVNIDVRC